MATSLSPVCCNILGVDIYWYGIAYVVGLWFALYYARRLTMHDERGACVDAFFSVACVCIIVGGRLGHVLFFDWSHYAHHLSDIIRIRDGGMSFHGGLLGVVLGAVWFCRKHRINFLYFSDIVAMVAPVGLGLGRVANFINGELYGVPTGVPWGVIFRNVPGGPRHPTQIYEAIAEGGLTFLVLWVCRRRMLRLSNGANGMISTIFLICYGLARFSIDFLKDTTRYNGFTVGQWLSMLMIVIGGCWLCMIKRRARLSCAG
ncbi:MAG: prolipoprotein diacylglyceryl transferase [Holosporales bacterium]|nr:prolipoprotein diacylglyceryl transferase [Holosporales bacterium]